MRRQRFRHDRIGTAFKQLVHFVSDGCSSATDDDTRVSGFPQGLDHAQTAQFRHEVVSNNQIKRPFTGKLEPITTIHCANYLSTKLSEEAIRERQEHAVIVNNQNRLSCKGQTVNIFFDIRRWCGQLGATAISNQRH